MPTRKKGKKKNNGFARNLAKAFESRPREYAALKFMVKFLLFAIPLYIILILNLRLEWLETFTADVSYGILQLLGIAVQRAGNLIVIPVAGGSWGAFINWDCTGWKSFLALFALVMATDFPLKNKLKGLCVLLPSLFAINIARIVFMFLYVNSFGLEFFDVIHASIWSWGLIAAILVFWIAWMKWSCRKPVKKRSK